MNRRPAIPFRVGARCKPRTQAPMNDTRSNPTGRPPSHGGRAQAPWLFNQSPTTLRCQRTTASAVFLSDNNTPLLQFLQLLIDLPSGSGPQPSTLNPQP